MITFISHTFPTLIMLAYKTDNIHGTWDQNFTLSRTWPSSKPIRGLNYINIYLLFHFPLKLFGTKLLVSWMEGQCLFGCSFNMSRTCWRDQRKTFTSETKNMELENQLKWTEPVSGPTQGCSPPKLKNNHPPKRPFFFRHSWSASKIMFTPFNSIVIVQVETYF